MGDYGELVALTIGLAYFGRCLVQAEPCRHDAGSRRCNQREYDAQHGRDINDHHIIGNHPVRRLQAYGQDLFDGLTRTRWIAILAGSNVLTDHLTTLIKWMV